MLLVLLVKLSGAENSYSSPDQQPKMQPVLNIIEYISHIWMCVLNINTKNITISRV